MLNERPRCCPEKPHLKRHYDPYYTPPGTSTNLRVQNEQGPLIEKYLQGLYQTICNAISEHPRTLASRFDLRFPSDYHLPVDCSANYYLKPFFESLRAKINHEHNSARRQGKRNHATSVRYAWCREQDRSPHPHYHVLLLINRDAYCSLGQIDFNNRNLFTKITEAWSSALKRPIESLEGIVDIGREKRTGGERLEWHLVPTDQYADLLNCFYYASYLCKSNTKDFNTPEHPFGTSRN